MWRASEARHTKSGAAMGRFTCALLLGLMPALAWRADERLRADRRRHHQGRHQKQQSRSEWPRSRRQRQRLRPQHQALGQRRVNVAVALVTRPATKTPIRPRAEPRQDHEEIYYVVRGSDTGDRTAGRQRDLAGRIGHHRGRDFPARARSSGGRATRLGPGEMQVIPPGVGHVWTDIAGGGSITW